MDSTSAADGKAQEERIRDPWDFQRWAFHQRTGNPGRKAVLAALGSMASAETGRCEAKHETLAQWAEISRRSVIRHIEALRDMGLIATRRQFRRDGSRRGDEYLLLAPWVTAWPDDEPIQSANVSPPIQSANGDRSKVPTATDEVSQLSQQELPPKNDHLGTENASRSTSSTATVTGLFDYWRERCDHPQARLTADRKAKVRARLKEGYTVEQLRQAIDGAAVGAFVNDAGHRFDDLELICRNGSKVEGFIGRAATPNGNGNGNGRASDDELRRHLYDGVRFDDLPRHQRQNIVESFQMGCKPWESGAEREPGEVRTAQPSGVIPAGGLV